MNMPFYLSNQVVGLPAKQGMIRNAQNTVRHLVKLIGQPYDSDVAQAEVNRSRCKVCTPNLSATLYSQCLIRYYFLLDYQ